MSRKTNKNTKVEAVKKEQEDVIVAFPSIAVLVKTEEGISNEILRLISEKKMVEAELSDCEYMYLKKGKKEFAEDIVKLNKLDKLIFYRMKELDVATIHLSKLNTYLYAKTDYSIEYIKLYERISDYNKSRLFKNEIQERMLFESKRTFQQLNGIEIEYLSYGVIFEGKKYPIYQEKKDSNKKQEGNKKRKFDQIDDDVIEITGFEQKKKKVLKFDLPDDLIVSILEFLPKKMDYIKVSKQFFDVVNRMNLVYTNYSSVPLTVMKFLLSVKPRKVIFQRFPLGSEKLISDVSCLRKVHVVDTPKHFVYQFFIDTNVEITVTYDLNTAYLNMKNIFSTSRSKFKYYKPKAVLDFFYTDKIIDWDQEREVLTWLQKNKLMNEMFNDEVENEKAVVRMLSKFQIEKLQEFNAVVSLKEALAKATPEFLEIALLRSECSILDAVLSLKKLNFSTFYESEKISNFILDQIDKKNEELIEVLTKYEFNFKKIFENCDITKIIRKFNHYDFYFMKKVVDYGFDIKSFKFNGIIIHVLIDSMDDGINFFLDIDYDFTEYFKKYEESFIHVLKSQSSKMLEKYLQYDPDFEKFYALEKAGDLISVMFLKEGWCQQVQKLHNYGFNFDKLKYGKTALSNLIHAFTDHFDNFQVAMNKKFCFQKLTKESFFVTLIGYEHVNAELFLQYFQNVSFTQEEMATAFETCINKENQAGIDLLLKYGFDKTEFMKSESNFELFNNLIKNSENKLSTLKFLRKNGYDLNKYFE